MTTYANCKQLVDVGRLTKGAAGYNFYTRYRVEHVTTDADYIALNAATSFIVSPEDFAANLPNRMGRESIPARGDVRYIAQDFTIAGSSSTVTPVALYCLEKTVTHPTTAKDLMHVDLVYGELGLPVDQNGAIRGSANTYSWLVGASVNGNIINTTANKGWSISGTNETYGQLNSVYYSPTSSTYDYASDLSLAANIATGSVWTQLASVASTETIVSFQLNMREIARIGYTNANAVLQDAMRSIQGKARYFCGAMNSSAIWGFPAYTLRMRMLPGDMDAMRNISIVSPDDSTKRLTVWDTQYVFEYRQRTWNEIGTIVIPWTGQGPPNIADPSTGLAGGADHGNGWRQFSPAIPRDFSVLGLPDIRSL